MEKPFYQYRIAIDKIAMKEASEYSMQRGLIGHLAGSNCLAVVFLHGMGEALKAVDP